MNFDKLRIGNAAGMVKTLEQVEKACKGPATQVTVGSITMAPQAGNKPDPGYGRVDYYHPYEHWMLNALGMPNMGLAELLKVLPGMAQNAHRHGKQLVVSVAGYSPEEYMTLASECFAGGADEVELNLGCPNVWGPTGQKPIPSYDPQLTESILRTVRAATRGKKVGVKISPVINKQILEPLVYRIAKSDIVSYVAACNTIPNQERMGHDGHHGLSFANGNHKGGLSGEPLRPTSLEVCRYVRQTLPHTIDVIGIGGIANASHAKQYLDLGLQGISFGAAFYQFGPKIISDVVTELANEMA